ncbi:MAG: SA1362 family protein [Sporolactobacillus sp.]
MSVKTFLYSLAFFSIVGLGLFGLLSLFFDHQQAFFVQLIIAAVVVVIGLFFFRRLADDTVRTDQNRYRKAAKQTAKRRKLTAYRKLRGIHASRLKVISSSPHSFKDLGRRSAKPHGHLTVIEGKKNKKKKRVLF